MIPNTFEVSLAPDSQRAVLSFLICLGCLSCALRSLSLALIAAGVWFDIVYSSFPWRVA